MGSTSPKASLKALGHSMSRRNVFILDLDLGQEAQHPMERLKEILRHIYENIPQALNNLSKEMEYVSELKNGRPVVGP